MPWRWLKVFILLVFALVFFQILRTQEKKDEVRLVKLRFSLPLPKDVIQEHLLDRVEVKEVYVSGDFCEWNPTNKRYLMRREGQVWTVRVPFHSGKNEYCFVVRLADYPDLIWVQDPSAHRQIPDGYGRYNSLYVLRSWQVLRKIFHLLLLALIVISSMILVLEPLFYFLSTRSFSLRVKFLLFAFLLIFFSGSVLIFSQYRESFVLLKNFLVEEVNAFHLSLVSEGVDFSKWDEEENLKKIKKALDRSLNLVLVRKNFDFYHHRELSISDLVLFDTNWNIVSYSERFARHFDKNKLLSAGYSDLKRFYREGYFGDVIQRVQSEDHFDFRFGRVPNRLRQLYPRGFKRHFFCLPGNVFLVPIYQEDRLLAYYGGIFEADLWNDILCRQLLFQVFLLFVIIFGAGMIVGKIGGILIAHLRFLREWAEQIGNHDLPQTLSIQTGDEIEILAQTMEKMRLNLQKEFKTLRQLYYFKSKFYGSLSHELKAPLNSILESVESLRYGFFGKSEEIIKELKLLSKEDFSDFSGKERIEQQISVLMNLSKKEYQLKKLGFLQLMRMIEGKGKDSVKKVKRILENLDVEEKEIKESYRVIRDSVRNIWKMTEMMLKLAELNQLEFPLEKRSLALKPFLDRLVRDISITSEYQEKKDRVRILLEVEDNLPVRVRINELWNKKVLTSLFLNAIQNTEKGVILLSLERKEEFLLFSVADTGNGMKAEEWEKIRQEEGFHRNFPEFGVSLALSYQLIVMQGGEMGFESKAGKGTKFWFTLPLEEG